jgi:hypothetical protein
MTFPQTGASLWGPFEQYWKANGGLAQFGMPRTGVFPVKDGGYDAQWFERAMFTYNPNNPDPHKVELQLLGNMVTANRRGEAPFQRAPAMASAIAQYFPATGHNLSGKFLEYWRSKGGLPIYGYPISEQFAEKSKSDGKEYLVQYFERNRFELHPELAGTPYEVQLGLLGSELLDTRGGPSAFASLGAPLRYPVQGSGQAPGTYPKFGHAADYSWVAGQVRFTRIQGGCVFIATSPAANTATPGGSVSGPVVGTAVSGGNTSPPLSQITPQPPGPAAQPVPQEGAMFVPGGPGWDLSKVKDGDYVVIFGRLARAGDPMEMCPGGHNYVVERFTLNQ